MDYKKTKAASSTISRNIDQLAEETGNIYESVMILAKRSNQIASELKGVEPEITEFAYTDNSKDTKTVSKEI